MGWSPHFCHYLVLTCWQQAGEDLQRQMNQICLSHRLVESSKYWCCAAIKEQLVLCSNKRTITKDFCQALESEVGVFKHQKPNYKKIAWNLTSGFIKELYEFFVVVVWGVYDLEWWHILQTLVVKYNKDGKLVGFKPELWTFDSFPTTKESFRQWFRNMEFRNMECMCPAQPNQAFWKNMTHIYTTSDYNWGLICFDLVLVF